MKTYKTDVAPGSPLSRPASLKPSLSFSKKESFNNINDTGALNDEAEVDLDDDHI